MFFGTSFRTWYAALPQDNHLVLLFYLALKQIYTMIMSWDFRGNWKMDAANQLHGVTDARVSSRPIVLWLFGAPKVVIRLTIQFIGKLSVKIHEFLLFAVLCFAWICYMVGWLCSLYWNAVRPPVTIKRADENPSLITWRIRCQGLSFLLWSRAKHPLFFDACSAGSACLCLTCYLNLIENLQFFKHDLSPKMLQILAQENL
jgi:hypothetical protein